MTAPWYEWSMWHTLHAQCTTPIATLNTRPCADRNPPCALQTGAVKAISQLASWPLDARLRPLDRGGWKQ